MRLFPIASLKDGWREARWSAGRRLAQWSRHDAAAFYERLLAEGYNPERFIRVVTEPPMIYISVSKAASTRIKAILSEIAGKRSLVTNPARESKFRDTANPRRVGFGTFYRLAKNPETLRFTFVRNPYQRLVSCWANKFQGLPLTAGDGKIETYLAWRSEVDPRLPSGPDRTMSFSDFVVYACATNTLRIDQHWNLQTDVIEMPGIALDFIGKVENFAVDISRVLDHAQADADLRTRIAERAMQPLNPSSRGRCAQYFTAELAEMTYRAYEQDFDRLRYPKALPD